MTNTAMKTLANVKREVKGTLTVESVLNRKSVSKDAIRLAALKLRSGIIAIS